MSTQPVNNSSIWDILKRIAEVLGAFALIISVFTGPWGAQIPEMPYYGLLAAFFFTGLLFIWTELKQSKIWLKSLLSVVAFAVALGLGYAYWYYSRPAFEITAINTLPGDSQAYEITDYMLWNQKQAILDQYQVETKFVIQIVPAYIGKSRFGEVVVRIFSDAGSNIYREQSLWADFNADAETQKIALSLAELVKYSGITENSGLENRLEKFAYHQGKLHVQVFPVSDPQHPWKTQAITIRNAPWEQRIELMERSGQNSVDVYLKNYGGPGKFFTHYKLVQLNDVGSTPLAHATNSATTRLDSGIVEVDPHTLNTNQSTTFSIPLALPTNPGRYAVEVYTVKRQPFVNWDIAYANAPWWFSPKSQIEYFIVKQNAPATPFEIEAVRLKTEQNIDLGVPTGPVEDVTSPRNVDGQRQAFTNGMVYFYGGQAYAMYGPVYQHYLAMDVDYFPTSQISTVTSSKGETADFMQFEPVGAQDMPSAIHANQKNAAWTEGWIGKLFEQSGGAAGWLGFPVSDMTVQSNSVIQVFEYGYIVYYFPEVNGERDYSRPPVVIPYVSTLGANGKIFDVQPAPWQDTGLEVEEGQLVWIEYIGGRWTDNAETNPDGYSANGNGLLGYAEGTLSDKAVVGALLARIGGENGRVYTIGRWAVIVAPTSGKLELAMNDNGYEYNDGLVTVKIDIIATK